MSMPSMLLQDAPLLGCVMWQLLPTLAKSGPHVCTRWLPFCHANSITIVTMHIWKPRQETAICKFAQSQTTDDQTHASTIQTASTLLFFYHINHHDLRKTWPQQQQWRHPGMSHPQFITANCGSLDLQTQICVFSWNTHLLPLAPSLVSSMCEIPTLTPLPMTQYALDFSGMQSQY